jgi:hypothetical protein
MTLTNDQSTFAIHVSAKVDKEPIRFRFYKTDSFSVFGAMHKSGLSVGCALSLFNQKDLIDERGSDSGNTGVIEWRNIDRDIVACVSCGRDQA